MIFRKEAIAGMDRVTSRRARRVQNLADIQIALARGCRPQPVSLIGEANVQRSAVRVAIDCCRPHAKLAASAQDAHGDFPAVRNQNLSEHSVT